MNSSEITRLIRLVGIIAGLFLLIAGTARFFTSDGDGLLQIAIGAGGLSACLLWRLSEKTEATSEMWGISRYWWVLIIIVALGYMFGKDLAFKHNEADQATIASDDAS